MVNTFRRTTRTAQIQTLRDVMIDQLSKYKEENQ